MKKRTLTSQELDRVIKLKQGGTSWLQIENTTDIPRRTAQRAYEEWERSQSLEQLGEARRIVAGEEFRKHIRDVILLAVALADHVDVPYFPDSGVGAKAILMQLWEKPILAEHENMYSIIPSTQKENRRRVRQNRMLFDSLKSHTHEINWLEVLKGWGLSYNKCVNSFAMLRKEATEAVDNILNQKLELKQKIERIHGMENACELIVKPVLESIWKGILNDKLDQGRFSVQSTKDGEVTFQTTYGDPSVNLGPNVSEKELAEGLVEVCNWAYNNLSHSDTVVEIKNTVSEIRSKTDKLEGMLDPMLLRPMILRTRCDLCPV
ncbi:hypothetical protein ACFLWV_03405 [Chloroflexota bacterium]